MTTARESLARHLHETMKAAPHPDANKQVTDMLDRYRVQAKPGTEVQPGERKFTDYALVPGYSYGRSIDRLNPGRRPLNDTPWDLGGYPTAFPLY